MTAPRAPADRIRAPAAQGRFLIIGNAGHGKDTVAEWLAAAFGIEATSVSRFAGRNAVWPLVSGCYRNFTEAYADRGNHRALWFHALAAYDLRPAAISTVSRALAYFDVITGVRNRREFHNCRADFEKIIWVDASYRLPMEQGASIELNANDADIIIYNNGSRADLGRALARTFPQVDQQRTASLLGWKK